MPIPPTSGIQLGFLDLGNNLVDLIFARLFLAVLGRVLLIADKCTYWLAALSPSTGRWCGSRRFGSRCRRSGLGRWRGCCVRGVGLRLVSCLGLFPLLLFRLDFFLLRLELLLPLLLPL